MHVELSAQLLIGKFRCRAGTGSGGIGPPFRAPVGETEEHRARVGETDFAQEACKRGGGRAVRRAAQLHRKALPRFGQQCARRIDQGCVLRRHLLRGWWPAARARRAERGQTDDAKKPAMKGVDGHSRLRRQHRLVEPARARQGSARFATVETALLQKVQCIGVSREREIAQPEIEPRAHFLRGFAGEGERENAARRSAGEQQAQHARHQQPGLATAGAGFDHGRALRVECAHEIVGAAHRMGAGAVCAHAAASGAALRQ